MKFDLYVDGSFKESVSNVVHGGMILLHENKPIAAQRYVTESRDFTSMRNVGGELMATLCGSMVTFVMMGEYQNTEPFHLTIYHDYIGIHKFVAESQPWKATKPGSIIYTAEMLRLMESVRNTVQVKFKKVKAHSGDKWNELADVIAGGGTPVECTDVLLPVFQFLKGEEN